MFDFEERESGTETCWSPATLVQCVSVRPWLLIPGETEPVPFGVHGAIAEHYGRAPGTYQPHATTIDYLVAATAG